MKISESIYKFVAAIPAIGLAFLPKLVCPVCWPVYTTLLSSMGIGFVNYTPYLMPLTFVFVLVAVGTILYRAKTRKGYGPFVVGLFASIILLLGKFAFNSDSALFVGVGFLVIASLWNAWPQKNKDDFCPSCVSTPYQEKSR